MRFLRPMPHAGQASISGLGHQMFLPLTCNIVPHGLVACGLRGAGAATTTTAVAGMVPVVGRVPSGPLGGRTGTAGPADCDSTFMYHLLAQRAFFGSTPLQKVHVLLVYASGVTNTGKCLASRRIMPTPIGRRDALHIDHRNPTFPA